MHQSAGVIRRCDVSIQVGIALIGVFYQHVTGGDGIAVEQRAGGGMPEMPTRSRMPRALARMCGSIGRGDALAGPCAVGVTCPY